MRLSHTATVCLLLSLALTLPGCGDRTAAEDGLAGRSSAMPDAPPSKAPSAAGRCRRQLQVFVGSMNSLREQLAIGLSYGDYLQQVRHLRAAYSEVSAERLALGCLTEAGAPGERALNRYLEAANTWGECLASVSCSSEEVEPKLQHRWALASELLAVAQKGLR